MNIFKFTTIIIVISLLSCNSKGSKGGNKRKTNGVNQYETMKVVQDSTLIKIDIPEGQLVQELKHSSIIDSTWHVKLQTNEQSSFWRNSSVDCA